MSYTSRQPRACRRILPLSWVLALLLPTSVVLAQTSSPETRLETIRQLLQTLDQQALACQQTLEDVEQDQPGESCQRFLAAIDGDSVGDYLQQCLALKQWREELISSRQGVAPAEDDSINLQRLMSIEVYCGDNALLERTEHVAASFAALQQKLATTAGSGLRDFRSGNRQFPRSQRPDTDSANRRLRAETTELWRQLELENLRQQQRRPD